nr:hypothetical protein [Tanacetum cinerariifolium]
MAAKDSCLGSKRKKQRWMAHRKTMCDEDDQWIH